ncbi:MAG: primosomal protein N', partial [Bacteroidales bacterium]|nr:primosomal protein N' [Bacteroidales bacterium]
EVPKYPTKYILSILDTSPILSERQFRFWEWMASYYMCYLGDVMAIALPSALRLSSESYITMHPDFAGGIENLTQDEWKVVEALKGRQGMPMSQVPNATGFEKVLPLVQTMIEKHIIIMVEELTQRYVPKAMPYLSLAPEYCEEKGMRELFERLEDKSTTRKQLSALMRFMQLSRFGKERIAKKQLTSFEELSPSAIATLVKNGVLIQETQTVSRLAKGDANAKVADIVLNEEQQAAYEYLHEGIADHAIHAMNTPDRAGDAPRTARITERPVVSLLHGVTSSGKTEVYIKLIDDVVRQGRQVLFLLPEIALTAQIINRLRKYFGDMVGVYHSRFNANERVEVWQRTMETSEHGYKIILGARSAVFLPFYDLGLAIVDEEHDGSYKQQEPAPRYMGRDCAIVLSRLYKNARVVLGSATPSVETYHNAKQGKYGYARLEHRYGGMQMPLVECVDMRGEEKHTLISKPLRTAIQSALDEGLQTILFQNRRGFAPHLECLDCHWIPQCVQCDVSLVYHKATNNLRCHYCGYSIPLPTECPMCHSKNLTTKGFGTERIEEDLQILFPHARIDRLDMDSTSQKNKYIEILNAFEEHRTDILVGTQMVTKGLDFEHVGVVGILSADDIVSYPNFRSYERAFQLMTQVSGRAGRRERRGHVLIQTYHPDHAVISDAMRNDYEGMYDKQINDRRIFRYPPYYRLIDITLRHANVVTLNDAAAHLASELRKTLGNRVIGPEYPIVPRIRGLYLKSLRLRFSRDEGVSKGKEIILAATENLLAAPNYKHVRIQYDVDPL